MFRAVDQKIPVRAVACVWVRSDLDLGVFTPVDQKIPGRAVACVCGCVQT